MNHASAMSPLDTILALTEQVQTAIVEGDWQRAHTLETERRSLLEQFVTEEGPVDENEGLRAALTQLQQRNDHMLGEVHHHRRRVLREASMLKAGHDAAGAYGKTLTERHELDSNP